jgi:hypothetical protein
MPVVEPRDVDPRMPIKAPDPSVDYKLRIKPVPDDAPRG